MPDKVKAAIFNNDLRVKLEKYELSANGNKIKIVPEGAGYFMPEIGPTTFLDWPKRKRYILFGPTVYERIFFALNKGSQCVDFLTGVTYGPDVEQQKKANMSFLAREIGADRDSGTPWAVYLSLFFTFLILMLLLARS